METARLIAKSGGIEEYKTDSAGSIFIDARFSSKNYGKAYNRNPLRGPADIINIDNVRLIK